MDDRRFDTIIRALGSGSTRRVVLGGVAASVGGLLAPFSTRSARSQAPCEGGLVDCGGVCVDVSSDPTNCGGCGGACGEGGSCGGGSCFFAVGSGTCATSCSTPYVQDPVSCACLCPAGLVDCGGICADVSSDPANCGGCGVVCPSGACVGGACACAAGTVPCGDECVAACGDPLVLDPATCACICPLECGAGQTLDPAACTCSDAPTPTAVPEATTTPEAPSTPAGITGATDATAVTGATDEEGTPPSADAIVWSCTLTCSLSKWECTLVCTIGSGSAGTAAASAGPTPTYLEIDQSTTPGTYSTTMQFAEAEGAAPFMEVQGTITPGGQSMLAFAGDGLDWQVDFDERGGEVAVTSGGTRVSGTFNPTTGQIDGLTGELPPFAFPDAMLVRGMVLEPVFQTMVAASEDSRRMNFPEAGTCLPEEDTFNAQTKCGIGRGIAKTLGAGCCSIEGNCTGCQTVGTVLASVFPDA